MPIRLDHIAVAVHRLSDATSTIVGLLGGAPAEGGPGRGFRGAQWRFDGGGRLEVLEPVGPPDGFLYRFLAAHGPRVHHATFIVPELRAAADRARALGFDVVGYEDSKPWWKEAFLHPKKALGIVVQLAESHTDIPGDSWTKDFPFPAASPAAVPPVRLVGVRLSARSLEAAERQFGTLLGGTCRETAGGVAYHWDDSPLRIAVSVDATRPEGPLCLEVERQPPPRLPDAIDPRFGVRVVAVTGSRSGSPDRTAGSC